MAKIPERFRNYMFNENDFLPETYEIADPEKEELVRKLVMLISDDITFRSPKKLDLTEPDVWLIDRLLTKEEVRFMLSFKKKRTVKLTIEELAERNVMSVQEAQEIVDRQRRIHDDERKTAGRTSGSRDVLQLRFQRSCRQGCPHGSSGRRRTGNARHPCGKGN